MSVCYPKAKFQEKYQANLLLGLFRPSMTLIHYGFEVIFKGGSTSGAAAVPPSAAASTSSVAVVISAIRSNSPDYVELTNISLSDVNLEGFKIKEGSHSFTFPSNVKLQPGSKVRVYMFSAKDAGKVNQVRLEPGEFLQQGWGISAGETVSLVDRDGALLHQRRA